jgi:hypothetical protein
MKTETEQEYQERVSQDMIEFKKGEVERLEMLETQVPRDLLYIGHNIVSHHETKDSEAFVQWCLNELTVVLEKIRETKSLGHIRYEMQRIEAEEERKRVQEKEKTGSEKAMRAAEILQAQGIDFNDVIVDGVGVYQAVDGDLKPHRSDPDLPF